MLLACARLLRHIQFMPLAAEIPRVRVQIVDAYGNILSHANCAACLTVSMRTPPDEPCHAFGIRSNLADCMAELPWHETPDSYCETSVNLGSSYFIALGPCVPLPRFLLYAFCLFKRMC